MNDKSDEDDDHMMGTAFPELDDQQIVSKKADIDLTVRDEKGRRRFHGAFTGGFSAGYWNTVGSAEGFTPSQFVSTRKEKWDKNLLRQKPEDFMDSEDLGVFGIAPQTVHTRDEFAQQQFAGLRDSNATVIDVLKSVIKPTVESIGVRLYKQMKRSATIENNVNVYGCDNTSDDNVKTSDILVKPKCDFHGIGYKGMITPTDDTHLAQTSNTAGISAVLSGGRKIKISGEAFGYGALEEEENDEDDAVIYYKDDMSRYDYETGNINKKANQPNKGAITKEIEYGKTNIIAGFVKCSPVSSLKSIINKKYPLPVIPRDWKPSKQRNRDKKQKKSRWDQKTSQTDEQNIANQEDNDRNDAKPPVLNANARAVILGDEIVRIQCVKQTPVIIEQTVNSESNSSVPERAVQSNKPLSGFWANKFVRETEGSDDKIFGGLTEFSDKPSAAVENTVKPEEDSQIIERVTYEWHPINLLCKRFNVPNPYPQFPDVVGIVTAGKLDVRNRTSFLHNEKKIDNIFSILNQANNSFKSNLSDDISVLSDNRKTNHNKEAINYTKKDIYEETIEDNTEESEQNEERPPMDLFKAIFASDDETDDENNSVVESSNTEKIPDTENAIAITKATTTGLFSNIDFDQLNRNFNPIIKPDSVETENKAEPIIDNITIVQNSETDDTYGPVLPPLYSVDTTNKSIENRPKSPKRKRKHKKHKKHKKLSVEHKKHKSRHRRHSSSSSSNSSSDTDTDKHLLEYLKSSRR